MKIIKKLNLDLSDLPATSERRRFTILGDNGAEFKLEIKDNTTGYYYNFVTNVFQVAAASLEGEIGGNSYIGGITFPAVTGSDDQYDIYLYAKPGTRHNNYNEVRFGDGSIDINSSTGSNSLMMQKVIYQYTALTLTLNGYDPSTTTTPGTSTTDTISINRGKSKAKTAFSFTYTAATTAAYRILKQPVEGDVLAFVSPVIGSAPVTLPGEDIWPAGIDVRSTDAIDGSVESATKLVMTTNVATIMKVGDRVTGTGIPSSARVTVVALNPDGDNVKEFSVSETVSIADEIPLSFTEPRYYSWPINNYADKLIEGMIVVPATNVTAGTVVSAYQDAITILEGTQDEDIIVKNEIPALDTLGVKPTIVKGLITVQSGNIVFNKQQVLDLAGDTLKIGGYGERQILNLYGWEIKFTDLAIALTPPTTTTTEATTAHATIAVTSKEGVINNVSRVGGIGINPALQNPLITSGGGATGGGDWIMDAVQTLENGITLTVENTARVATITGNIQVVKAGTASQTLRFDVEKLLSIT